MEETLLGVETELNVPADPIDTVVGDTETVPRDIGLGDTVLDLGLGAFPPGVAVVEEETGTGT